MKIPHQENSAFKSCWNKLLQHHDELKDKRVIDLFNSDPQRINKYNFNSEKIHLDISKHIINDTTLDLLISLVRASTLESGIKSLFNADNINVTEKRPALHTALRSDHSTKLDLDDIDVIKNIHDELNKIETFVHNLHSGKIRGSNDKPIKALVNIGIGGSDLGPKLVVNALKHYDKNLIKIHFVSNVDPVALDSILSDLDPDTTLICIASKSFKTSETLHNAKTAKKWFIDNGCRDFAKHFIAVSANETAVMEFGIPETHYFRIWEWVGGRFSLWSAIGLTIAASLGMENFRSLLAGANRMDQHFFNTPFHQNIPVILGLLDIWYCNFFKSATLAIIPYENRLALLPDYLGQLMMESNGKSVTIDECKIDYPTCPIIWGGVGTDAQHAFFQLLHQGTHLLPVEFLVGKKSSSSNQEQHKLLIANCLAQSQTLMLGGNMDTNRPYMNIEGNIPNTIIMYDRLEPETLGALLAMYEHRTFVQGHIWNINSFDQWGVELGKTSANKIYQSLGEGGVTNGYDPSTENFIKKITRH